MKVYIITRMSATCNYGFLCVLVYWIHTSVSVLQVNDTGTDEPRSGETDGPLSEENPKQRPDKEWAHLQIHRIMLADANLCGYTFLFYTSGLIIYEQHSG